MSGELPSNRSQLMSMTTPGNMKQSKDIEDEKKLTESVDLSEATNATKANNVGQEGTNTNLVAEEPQTMSLSANKTSATLEDLEKLKKEYQVRKSQLQLIKNQFASKKQESINLEKQMQKRREQWQQQRQRIIEKYFAQLPKEVTKHHDLTNTLNKKKNQNMCIKTSLDISNNRLQNELNQLTRVYNEQRSIAEQTQEHNRQLHLRMDELRKELAELDVELSNENNKIISEPKAPEAGANAVFSEYPPESTVIENLLQAQVEFYFSDYNLKRDKRLLMEVDRLPHKGYLPIEHVMKLARIRQLCSESHVLIAALERSKILSLKKVVANKNENSKDGNNKDKENNKNNDNKNESKTDGSSKSESKDSSSESKSEAKASEVGETKNGKNEKNDKNDKNDKSDKNSGNITYEYWVGRDSFERPREKEFPFRRTVFIFGIPWIDEKEAEKFLKEMLKPFGQITKIQFDDGNESLDRKIGKKFLQKSRVYDLTVPITVNNNGMNNMMNNMNNNIDTLDPNNRVLMEFYTEYKFADNKQSINVITCHRCNKSKPVGEGFYHSIDKSLVYCAQCAAVLAEKQLTDSYKIKDSFKRDAFLGKKHRDLEGINGKKEGEKNENEGNNENGGNVGNAGNNENENESGNYRMLTALVVFASQRQASKCAYVRTRIAYQGAFATHFHHYSKVKKDIVSSNDPDSVEIKDDMLESMQFELDTASTATGATTDVTVNVNSGHNNNHNNHSHNNNHHHNNHNNNYDPNMHNMNDNMMNMGMNMNMNNNDMNNMNNNMNKNSGGGNKRRKNRNKRNWNRGRGKNQNNNNNNNNNMNPNNPNNNQYYSHNAHNAHNPQMQGSMQAMHMQGMHQIQYIGGYGNNMGNGGNLPPIQRSMWEHNDPQQLHKQQMQRTQSQQQRMQQTHHSQHSQHQHQHQQQHMQQSHQGNKGPKHKNDAKSKKDPNISRQKSAPASIA